MVWVSMTGTWSTGPSWIALAGLCVALARGAVRGDTGPPGHGGHGHEVGYQLAFTGGHLDAVGGERPCPGGPAELGMRQTDRLGSIPVRSLRTALEEG